MAGIKKLRILYLLCKELNVIKSCLFFTDFLKFIYLLGRGRERENEQAGEGQRERKTQNLKSAPGSELSAQSLMAGLELKNLEIMTWAKVRHITD